MGNAFGAAQRSVACFMVGRHNKAVGTTFFSLGTAGASPPNTGGGVLRTVAQSAGGAIMSGCGSRPPTGASANVAALFTGTQLQVLGYSSRATAGTGANQGQRLSVNGLAGNVDRASTALSGSGATIGSNAFTPGATDWFDLYEMVVLKGDLTDAQHDAIAAALVANWAIPPLTDQLVLEGDSITAGILDAAGTGVISGCSLGMLLTEPGAELIPPTVRVINQAISGNQVAHLVTRRDQAGAVFDIGRLAGRNVVAPHVGRNDWTGTTQSGTDTYAAIVALIGAGGTGYLARGWEVMQASNIANGGAGPSWTQQRARCSAQAASSPTARRGRGSYMTASSRGWSCR